MENLTLHRRGASFVFCIFLAAAASGTGCGDVEKVAADGGPGTACAEAELSCPEFATCVETSGEPACQCIEGHTGDDCSACDDGYQDNDSDGSCLASCALEDCSGAGTCDDASGTTVCTCDRFRGGPSCEGCASGYELDGGDCVWSGLIQNGGFNGADSWEVTGDAKINNSAASFSPAVICSGGQVSQTVEMPTWEASEPLILRFRTRSMNPMSADSQLAAYVGGYHAPIHNIAATLPESDALTELCLGREAYGRTLRVAFGRASLGSCSVSSAIVIDSVEIRPDTENLCPDETGLVNGDFSAGETGWSGDATIAGGELLFQGSQCVSRTQRTARLSLPPSAEMPGQALQLSYRAGTDGDGSSDSVHAAASGAGLGFPTDCNSPAQTRLALGYLNDASLTTHTACIPENMVGSVADLRFMIARKSGCGGCAAAFTFDSVVDDVAVIAEPACAGPIPDADQESALEPATTWLRNDIGTSSATFEKIDSAPDAHGGTKYLRLGIARHCDGFLARNHVKIPRPTADAGPALKFWYNLAAAGGGGTPTFQVCIGDDCQPLAETSGWQQQVVCLDFTGAGIPVDVRLQALGGNAGACGVAYPAEYVHFDDFEVTIDPTCDTQ